MAGYLSECMWLGEDLKLINPDSGMNVRELWFTVEPRSPSWVTFWESGSKKIIMLDIRHQSITSEDGKPIGVILDMATFHKIEAIIENYGLSRLMDEVEDDEELGKEEAIKFYNSVITGPKNGWMQIQENQYQRPGTYPWFLS